MPTARAPATIDGMAGLEFTGVRLEGDLRPRRVDDFAVVLKGLIVAQFAKPVDPQEKS